MGIKIVGRKVFTDYFNGPNLDLNTSDYKYHLYGSVSNMTKVLYEIDVEWGMRTSTTDVINKKFGSDILTRSSGSFIDEQFSIGDVINITTFKNYSGTQAVESALGLTVTGIDDKFMVVAGLDAAFTQKWGTWGEGGTTDGLHYMFINGVNVLEGLVMNFGLIKNSEPINFDSALDGSSQGFYVAGVGSGGSTAFVDGIFLGPYKGSQTGTLRARWVSGSGSTNKYEVEHIFRIIPYYLEGQTSDIENLITPEPFQGTDSIKYVSQYEFRNVISDENTAKKVRDELQVGSVGWFDQNYNNFTNIFAVSNLSYEDLAANPSNSLIVGEQTKVKFTVTSTENSFVTGPTSIVQVLASFLPLQDDYQLQADKYNDIWEVEQYRSYVDSNIATGQTIIKNVKIDLISATEIEVDMDVLYTGKTNTDQYVIGVEVANDGVTSDNSNKVLLKVDINTFQKSACIEDLLTVTQYQIEDGEGELVDGYGGYDEDGILLNYSVELNHALEANIESMEVLIVAFNPTTRDFFPVNSEVIEIENEAQKTDTYPYQEITTDITVGYKLDSTDPFNHRTINTGALAGPLRNYNGKVGIKIPWQDWLQLVGANEQFFDVTKPFGGLNQMSSNYNLTNGYELRPWLKIGMTGLNDLGVIGGTSYYLSTPAMNIGGYDDNPNVTTLIEYKDTLGGLISGSLLTNENTNVRVLITPSPDIVQINSYGILRLEAYPSQSDKEIYELSSIKPNYTDNAFAGLLLKNVVGSSLEFLGEIKSEYINDNQQYKVSFMLKCPVEECIILFTDVSPFVDGPFDPEATSTEVGIWYFEDATSINANSISTTGNGLNGTTQTVQYCLSDMGLLTELDFVNDHIVGQLDLTTAPNLHTLDAYFNQNLVSVLFATSPVVTVSLNFQTTGITGVLDLSGLTGLAGEIKGNSMPNLTGINFPTSSENIDRLSFSVTGLVGVLDTTGLSNLGGYFEFASNPLMTGINLAASTRPFTRVSAGGSNLTGVMDLTMLTKIGGIIAFNSNPLLTAVNFAFSSEIITNLNIELSGLVGTQDLQMLVNLGGDISFQGNPLLTTIDFPANSNVITKLWVYDCNLTTQLDLSSLTGLGGSVIGRNNPLLTSVSMPITTQVIGTLLFNDCNLTAVMDLTKLTSLEGSVYLYNNPLLTGVDFPITTGVFSQIQMHNCNITGVLDLTNISQLGGQLKIDNNPLLTGITFTGNSNVFTLMNLDDCNITGVFDVSALLGLGGQFFARTNPLLTGITLPASNEIFTNIHAYGCDAGYIDFTPLTAVNDGIDISIGNNNMVVGEVDNILLDLDGTGWINGTLLIDGTNAAPTGGAANANVVSLQGKGWTVLHT